MEQPPPSPIHLRHCRTCGPSHWDRRSSTWSTRRWKRWCPGLSQIRRVKEDKVGPAWPPPPGEEVAEAAGGGERNWLKDYVDRLTSSVSSSFSLLRFFGRWSHRYDDGGGGRGEGRGSWDLEGNHQQHEGEEISDNSFYRGRGEGAREGVLVEKEIDEGGAVAELPEILVSARPRTKRLMQREKEGGMGPKRSRLPPAWRDSRRERSSRESGRGPKRRLSKRRRFRSEAGDRKGAEDRETAARTGGGGMKGHEEILEQNYFFIIKYALKG